MCVRVCACVRVLSFLDGFPFCVLFYRAGHGGNSHKIRHCLFEICLFGSPCGPA